MERNNWLLKKFWNVNFIIRNLILPLGILVFYCALYSWFSKVFLPAGVTPLFASRLLAYTGVLLVAILGLLSVLVLSKKAGQFTYTYAVKKTGLSDWFLLLLPLVPVVQYLVNNQEILSAVDILLIIAFFSLISCLVIVIFPLLTGDAEAARLSKFIGLAFIFTVTSMPLLSKSFHWYQRGSLKIQLLVLLGSFAITWLLSRLQIKWVLPAFIVVFFISNTITQFVQSHQSSPESTGSMDTNPLLLAVSGKTPTFTPNVYLLLYDAYVSNETLLAHGIDNSAQEEYLVNEGFTLYPHTYSIGSDTLGSMSTVLNASTDFYGNERRAVSGDGVVQRIFRSLGYKAFGVFPTDYMFRGIGSHYDYLLPVNVTPVSLQVFRAILLGEFRFDLGFSDQPYEKFLETKQNILQGILGSPVFVYSHTDVPSHSQNSGECLPNETELFSQRLDLANAEMRQDVDTVLAHDPQAIVIIAGDHGPYLTKNCYFLSGVYETSEITRLDIQDRFGSFLAIRWPAGEYKEYDRITVLQDMFPAIFATMFQDAGILDSEIEPIIPSTNAISGASVDNGIIIGGVNNGQPLFLSGK